MVVAMVAMVAVVAFLAAAGVATPVVVVDTTLPDRPAP
jgi:hypothetical protein